MNYIKKPNLKNYKAFFLDMDGVVVKADQQIHGAVENVAELKTFGQVFILSNNSTRSREEFSHRLNSFSLDFPPEAIINSSFVLAKYLVENGGSRKAFTIGEEGLDQELKAAGHSLVDPEESEIIAVGMDRNLNYKKLQQALNALLGGASFFATNNDATFPIPDGQAPGAGASVGAIKGMGYEPKKIVGKPSSVTANIGMDSAGVKDPKKCLVIGDRLETDILLAEKAGMDSVLVLSGIETRQSIANREPQPTYVLNSLSELFTKTCRASPGEESAG